MHLQQSISDMSILVNVSDEEERVFLSNILSLLGNKNVLHASSEEEASQALAAGKFNLIFLRVASGEFDPQQLLRRIFSPQSGAAVFVVTAGGQSCGGFEKLAKTYGIEIAACFDEPYSLNTLAQELLSFSSGKRQNLDIALTSSRGRGL